MIKQLDIALEQLEVAVGHFNSSHPKFFAALTLAGAAEEILGRLVEEARKAAGHLDEKSDLARNLRPAIDDIVAGTQAIGSVLSPGTVFEEKRIRSLANSPRNIAKHGHANVWTGDPRTEARSLIDRAVDNYWKLFYANLVGLEPEWMDAYRRMRHQLVDATATSSSSLATS